MDITFSCEKCGQSLTVDEAGVGQLIDCPKCGDSLLVPTQSTAKAQLRPSTARNSEPPSGAFHGGKSPATLQVAPLSAVAGASSVKFKECPCCGKDVFATDGKCVHCGMILDDSESAAEIMTMSWSPTYSRQTFTQVGVILRSGTQLMVAEITLYPKDRIVKAQDLLATAKKKLGGFSTGLGFWGSPSWVVGGSLVLGAAESLVANSMAKEGDALLIELGQLQSELRKSSKSFPVCEIANVELVTPSSWITGHHRKVEFEVEVPGFISPRKEKASRIEVNHWIHNGEPYVIVKTDQGRTLTVVWENVEQYYVM